METSGLKCGAADCDFSTPDFSPDLFPTMVAHLQVLRVFRDSPETIFSFVTAQNQVHAATKHKVNTSTAVPSFSSTAMLSSADIMNASTIPAQDLARSRSASRSRSNTPKFNSLDYTYHSFSVRGRSRSRRRRDQHLAFPCPDCRERSFATEAGLYTHRF